MPTPSAELLRIDPLTGCKNFLGFLETCLNLSLSDLPRGDSAMEAIEASVVNASPYSAILFVEMNHMKFLNESRGRTHGDSAIRWMGILLGEESNNAVYRLGGVEFAVLLKMDTHSEYVRFVERILQRMDRESKLLGFPGPPSDIALIFYDQSPTSLDTILMQMGEAMVRVKNNNKSRPMIFNATDFKISAQAPHTWKPASDSDVSFAVRWLAPSRPVAGTNSARACQSHPP